MRRIIPTFILCFLAISIQSQDLHFTNYQFSPLYLSPAKTGSYLGSYRVGGSARQQFNSFIQNPYQTLTLYADSPVTNGFSKNHWIGVGISLYNDRAGDTERVINGLLSSISYHIGLDKNYNNVVSVGLQYGRSAMTFGTGIWPEEDENEKFQNLDINLSDINVGVSFKSKTSKTAFFEIGMAVYHLNKPKYRFSKGNTDNTIDRRYNFYGEYHIQSSDRLYIRPSIIYSRTYNFREFLGQFNLEYAPNKKSSTKITGGLGYRFGDALQFMAGVVYKDWQVGLSYDLTVSSAASYNNNFGGIELGVFRIFTVNKKPKLNPKALCPRL